MERSTLKEYSGSATEHMELIFPNNVPILRQILTQVLKHAAQNCINLKQIIRYQNALAAAINSDFSSRSLDESKLLDLLGSVLKLIMRFIIYAAGCVQVNAVPSFYFYRTVYVQYQPKGVVGVIVPEFPVYLALGRSLQLWLRAIES